MLSLCCCCFACIRLSLLRGQPGSLHVFHHNVVFVCSSCSQSWYIWKSKNMCDRRSRKKVPWEKGPALRSSLSSEVEHARGIMCGLHTCLFWCGRTKTVSVITRGVSRGKSSPVFGFAQSCHFSNVIPRAPAGGRISPKSTGVKSRQNCYNLTNILTIIINMLIRNQMIVCLISMSK